MQEDTNRSTHDSKIEVSSNPSDDDQQFAYERTVLFLRVLCYVHLVFGAVFLTLMLLDLDPPGRSIAVPILVLGTPVLLLGLFAGRNTEVFRAQLKNVELATTWMPCAFYLYVSLIETKEEPALLAVALVALVITVRSSLVPSTLLRTFWVGAVPMASILALSVLVPRPLSDALHTVWNTVLSGAFLVGTVVTSQVIYGLQRKLNAAKKLGQYELKSKLGEGGMGKVYLAQHAMLRRLAAVKVLSEGARVSQSSVSRFRDEVQFTSRLSHPNTVQVFDYGVTATGQFFYAMEYLDGATLQAIIEAAGPMNPNRTAYVLRKVAASLTEAHAQGLLHRDIKPANIMLCTLGGMDDSVKVLDFGLVQTVNEHNTSDDTASQDRLEGTPAYLAPECIVDAAGSETRSDLYGLGAVGYFLLCGAPPFEGVDMVDVLAKHLTEAPVPPSTRLFRDVDAELEATVLQCLQKDPSDRPANAADLEATLRGICERLPWSPADRTVWWAEHSGVVQSHRDAQAPAATRGDRLSRIGRRSYSPKSAR